jgi:hypothetical protein
MDSDVVGFVNPTGGTVLASYEFDPFWPDDPSDWVMGMPNPCRLLSIDREYRCSNRGVGQ